ncbi:MAG: hypothetical protein M3P00_10270 [Gemmatimonadota bacterium]|nr:hypothetical protein [Gemmatimonadota bacterium]
MTRAAVPHADPAEAAVEPAIACSEVVRGALVQLEENEKVTFTDLVFAHHLRQTTLYRAAQIGATDEDAAVARAADEAYRSRLTVFERDYGPIVRAYWCTYEISRGDYREKVSSPMVAAATSR